MEEDIKVLKRIYKNLKFEDSAGRIAIQNLLTIIEKLQAEHKRLKNKKEELTNEQGYWGTPDLLARLDEIEIILEE